MRIVVIGGTGQVGSRVVNMLEHLGVSVIPAAPATGVDIVAATGLREALDGADVVVDVTNYVTTDAAAAVAFFETAARNITLAEIAAGVTHHVALSVLGSDRLLASGYVAGKVAQERQVRSAPIPYSLVHAAQFFELLPMWMSMGATDGVARLPHARFQPIAADDVAEVLVELALSDPLDGSVEIAGPEPLLIDEVARRIVEARGDTLRIERDPKPTYFGAPIEADTLLPSGDFRATATDLETWLSRQGRPLAA